MSSNRTSNDAGVMAETGCDPEVLRALIAEKARRDCEALRLYRPLPATAAFHESKARQRLVRGSNRGGKTLAAAVEVARAVLDKDPYGKYPKRNGRCYCVAKNLGRVGDVMWSKLGRAGAFKMIRDRLTGEWRSFCPWDPSDLERVDEAKPAPPLIPPRAIKDIAWEEKKSNIPKRVYLHNGWEIAFFSSEGKPPQGVDIDLCLAGWAEVFDPILGQKRRIDKIDGPWHVLSLNRKTEEIEVRCASKPFVKGFGEICRVGLSNGEEIFTTRQHRVLALDGRWLSVQEAWQSGTPLACHAGLESHGQEAPAAPTPGTCQDIWPFERYSYACIGLSLPRPSCREDASPLSFVAYGDGRDLPETEFPGCLDRCWTCRHPYDEPSLRAADTSLWPPPLRGGACERSRWHSCVGVLVDGTEHSQLCPGHLGDLAAWGEGLWSELQRQPPSWLVTRASERLPAWLLSQQPSYRYRHIGGEQAPDQDPSSSRYLPACGEGCQPRQASDIDTGARCESAYTATLSRDHLPHTVDGECRHREMGEADNCPVCSSGTPTSEAGCIYITSLEVESQSAIWDISVEGNHNYLYGEIISSNCWFTEEIINEEWFPEMAARLLDRRGRFIWDATPQSGTEQLFLLHERAEEKTKVGRYLLAEEFEVMLKDNPYIQEEEKQILAASLTGEQYMVRVEGEYAYSSYKVYHEWDPRIHVVDDFPIPETWCRYASIDPGSQVCAVLFAAVPPLTGDDDRCGDFVYLYDELYIRKCDATKFGEGMFAKTDGHAFEAFVIDSHGARLRDIGSGKHPEEQYSEELRKRKVSCRRTGTKFTWGSDDREGGILATRQWLRVRPDGTTKLRVLRNRVPNFIDEIKRYHYKRDEKKQLTDIPVARNDHHMANFRYLAAYNPQYVKPQADARLSRALESYKKWTRLDQRYNRAQEDYIRLGAGKPS